MNGIYAIILSLCLYSGIKDNYPVPEKTIARLFYIQRNHNANTIVYDAVFDNKGILVEKSPVDIYWLRYQEQGQRMELRNIEKLLAYGAGCTPIEGRKNEYDLKLAANRKRNFRLVQKEPFKALVVTIINQQESQIDHIYVFADNTSLWPKVKYIELFGFSLETGKPTYERILNE